MMAGDSHQYAEALRNWQLLHDYNAYSVKKEQGTTAVFCSYFTDIYYDMPYNKKLANREIKTFRKEALKIAELILKSGRCVEVILNAMPRDFIEVIQDPMFSDIITIGNGSLSCLYMQDNERANLFDWNDISQAADHLKTGRFIQRQCGNFTRRLSVPLGLFAVADHRDVYAALGVNIAPRGLQHQDNNLIVPVTDYSPMTYKDIVTDFR